ncbi:hypothetical protein HRI_002612600 [Hibiscus trionum]|uniref:Uncharacterized protein n=1 Tax=Hibiscus trionum TaxID=183268 RepID=A0A9W7M651_HIBTR|nr:hypothetical protein HRI_002612600 [Hibiscus trionum]
MPGTIQVSVLDFKGLKPSSPSSEISVKVSMGKTEYQTCDTGEFSFPLTTLRDNLIITLQDAEGNEISHTGVETRLVIEKGVWDNIFSLEGGGQVHMKLQFVLSEEEHRRIRIMREAALKKKHEELCSSGHGSPKSSWVGYSEVSGSPESLFRTGLLADEASLMSLPFNNLKDAKFGVDDRDGSYPIQKRKNTDSVPPELEKANTSKKQGPAVKAHSNIRKMVSAFEGGLNQDVKSSTKPPPTISRTRETPVDSHLNDVKTEKTIPPKVDAGTAGEANKDGKTSEKLRPRSENSENPRDSVGPFGQVIKVIIMVGFATLVLLTRKRTYR